MYKRRYNILFCFFSLPLKALEIQGYEYFFGYFRACLDHNIMANSLLFFIGRDSDLE